MIVPTDFEGDIPDGYFVGRSPSRVNLLILRGLLVDGRPEAPTRTFKEGLKIYPLSAADNPPAMEFVSGSRKSFNTIHANNADFYEEVAEVIEREPVEAGVAGFGDRDRSGRDALAPDARMRAILDDPSAVGNATSRAPAFRTREPAAYLYDGSLWKAGFIGGDYRG